MDATIKGDFYNSVITEIVKPVIVDVSEDDYEAETFALNGQMKAEQRPFVIAHHEPVILKVLPFYSNEPVVWNFNTSPYPMPLRKIFKDAVNTVTTIQIGY